VPSLPNKLALPMWVAVRSNSRRKKAGS